MVKGIKQNTLLAVTFLLLMVGCDLSSNDNEQITVTISSTPQLCHHSWEYATLCSPAVTDSSGASRAFSPIIDFEYEFGTEYELLLEVIEIKNPPEDSSAYEYKILRTIRQEQDPIGTTYVYQDVSLTNDAFVSVGNGIYSLPPYEFQCAENVDCDTLVGMANSGGVVSIELTMIGGEIPVAVTVWN
ncbi:MULTISPECIES: DUF4377 domain-containing protein [Gammaproteobacteria]|uniref:DUF4377 domain-containing protein n=1 Tax=Gammaproteobacteria TaxID=1236 RepID=UPI000DD0B95C|nr:MULTISPECIES: DUF4377 domain-containing protein [Gammaproteobacteria]RTE85932.1 DUF4377 domain-containing protein [Aliidiomarina sp. B3213]TCZ90069.1 DUF4377 domain-containing protein [Lysobacter sp. N42]